MAGASVEARVDAELDAVAEVVGASEATRVAHVNNPRALTFRHHLVRQQSHCVQLTTPFEASAGYDYDRHCYGLIEIATATTTTTNCNYDRGGEAKGGASQNVNINIVNLIVMTTVGGQRPWSPVTLHRRCHVVCLCFSSVSCKPRQRQTLRGNGCQ